MSKWVCVGVCVWSVWSVSVCVWSMRACVRVRACVRACVCVGGLFGGIFPDQKPKKKKKGVYAEVNFSYGMSRALGYAYSKVGSSIHAYV